MARMMHDGLNVLSIWVVCYCLVVVQAEVDMVGGLYSEGDGVGGEQHRNERPPQQSGSLGSLHSIRILEHSDSGNGRVHVAQVRCCHWDCY